ncbi:hypothetical protein ABWK33_10925 [Bacillus wiedmannii]|uniref:hypothetical protein n=1 Tax=Bacillus wiedmannii TaxID=1890302 RepID=UPI00339A2C2F
MTINEGDLSSTFRCAYRFIDGNETDVIGAFPSIVISPQDRNDLEVIFVKATAGRTIEMANLLHHNDFAMSRLHNHFEGKDFMHDGETYVTGFPVHEFRENLAGVTLLYPKAVEVLPIPKNITSRYGIPININSWGDLVYTMVGVDKYALENDFVGGFLDCYPKGDYHRLFLFKRGYFERKPIPTWKLNHLRNFVYHFSNVDEIARCRKAYNIICKILDSCDVLSNDAKLKLREICNSHVAHHWVGLPVPPFDADAWAPHHASGIRFNPEFLSSASDYRLTGTMFHELMHNLGYTHPAANHPDYSNSIPERVKTCVPKDLALQGEDLEYIVKCGQFE